MHIVFVTGLAGAGKSTALRALEDLGYYCVDNIPLPLVVPFVDLVSQQQGISDAAISVDARQHAYLSEFNEQLAQLKKAGHRVEVLFLEAGDDMLLRRYSETRRRHPMSGDDLREGIRQDREVLAELRHSAAVLNTAALNVHQLKGIIQERYGKQEGKLAVTLLSFGFKNGVPVESDLVFDVRFLANPYFDPELSGLDGRNAGVASYVLDTDEGKQMLDKIDDLLRFSLPQFEREGKMYLTVAIGCTGGRHRSVAIVEELSRRLQAEWDLQVRHRDLERRG